MWEVTSLNLRGSPLMPMLNVKMWMMITYINLPACMAWSSYRLFSNMLQTNKARACATNSSTPTFFIHFHDFNFNSSSVFHIFSITNDSAANTFRSCWKDDIVGLKIVQPEFIIHNFPTVDIIYWRRSL